MSFVSYGAPVRSVSLRSNTYCICRNTGHKFDTHQSSRSKTHINCSTQLKSVILKFVRSSFISLLSTGLILSSPIDLQFTPAAVEARTLTYEEQRSVKLFNSNTSSVVNVTNLGMQQDAFTLDIMEIPQGAGTGIIWDDKGHIITNFHVIRQATEVQVTLPGGEQIMASVVGVDPDKDVAVLEIKTNAKEILKPVRIGRSSDLFVGQQVYAIGNPFGLDHTLTSGIISGTERELTGATDRPIQVRFSHKLVTLLCRE
eukprot:g8114.t1